MSERVVKDDVTLLGGVRLSPAEMKVFLLRLGGENSATIANQLGITQYSVWAYFSRVSEKADKVDTRPKRQVMAHMVLQAVVKGLVSYEGMSADLEFSKRESKMVGLLLRGADTGIIAHSLFFAKRTASLSLGDIDRKLGIYGTPNSRWLERIGKLAYIGLMQLQRAALHE